MTSDKEQTTPTLPLLITGVAGVAGYNAFLYFRHKYGKQVVAIRRKDNWPLRGDGIHGCDGHDRDQIRRLFDKHQFAAVLNCEGTCKLKSCELDPAMAERVNITSVQTLLDEIRGTSTRLVHLSIDLVYSGTRGGGHVEEDDTDPVTVYGKTMAEAERIILRQVVGTLRVASADDGTRRVPATGGEGARGTPLLPLGEGRGEGVGIVGPISPTPLPDGTGSVPTTLPDGTGSVPTTLNAAILRISLPMGVSFNGHAGAIDWIQSRFKHGRPATLYYDEVRTPAYTDCLNRLFATVLARHDLTGCFHAGGPRRLSLFQIAQIVNRVGGYDPDLLHGCMRIKAGPIPPRAGDVSMDSSKLSAALGYEPLDPWPLDDEHLPTHRQWHYESPRGSPELLAEVLYRNPRRKKRADRAALK